MLRLLCHVQQSSQSLCQSNIANINAGKFLIQLILRNQFFVYGAIFHAFIKAIADQLHFICMVCATLFTAYGNHVGFDFLNLSR